MRGTVLEAVLAAELAFLVYWANALAPTQPDATANIYLSWSMVWDGTSDLTRYAGVAPPLDFHQLRIGASTYAPYLPGNAILFAPFALAAGLLGLEPTSGEVAGLLGKLASSLALAFGLGATFLVIASRAGRCAALFVTFALAFGTMAASVASQALLEHSTSIALIAAGLLLSTGRRHASLAGVPLGLALLVRPTNVFAAAAILGPVAHDRRSVAARAALWMTPALAFLLVYDQLTFGSATTLPRPLPTIDIGSGGIPGLLFSPSRGILVYSPFLLVALLVFGAAWRWRSDATVRLLRYGGLAFIGMLLVYGPYVEWWGGSSYGDRYLGDLLPLYGVAFGEAFARGWVRSTGARLLVAIAVGWGVLLHLLGMATALLDWHGAHWDLTPPIDATPWRLWSWTDPEWLFFLRRVVNDPPIPAFLTAAAFVAAAAAYVFLARRASSEASEASASFASRSALIR